MDAEVGLTLAESFGAECVDILDDGVGHGETSDGDLVAVNHER